MEIKRTILLAGFLALLIAGIKLSFKKSEPEVSYDSFEDDYEYKRPKKKKKIPSARTPASLTQTYFPEKTVAGFRENSRNDDLFRDNAEGEIAPVISSGPVDNGGAPIVTENSGYRPDYRSRLPAGTSNPPTQTKTLPSNNDSITFSNVGLDSPATPLTPDSDSDDDENNSRNGRSSDDDLNEELTCSASVGEGSFATPINLTLSCSSPSEIKYCISEGSCCDPDTGMDYVSTFTVGATASTYCVSFKGISNDGDISSIVQKNYTFNPALADLQINHRKKFYQTTELMGLMSLASNDFGVTGLSVGVMNMKSHDPGTSGLGLTCQQIIEDDHSSLSPDIPALIMTDTDTSGVTSSSQIDIGLDTTNLQYGDNYLTSYIKNTLFGSPVYSCSTAKITLKDFEFFQFTPTNYIAASPTVGEFSGGFTHLGFFEPTTSIINRAPAGLDGNEVDSEELRFGLFGIFY